MSTHPHVKIADVLQAYAPYPAPIRPYLLKADTHPVLRSLFTRSGLLVLLDILGRAPVNNPERPVKLRVDKIAQTINRSEKTVQRVLNVLQSKEWLLRSTEHDGRNYRGRFCYREFLVGNELRQMLGLPTSKTEMSDGEITFCELTTELSTKSVDNIAEKTEMSDGHRGVNKNRKEDLKEASFKKSTSKEKTNGLPKDLILMQTELELSKGGVCALMALAAKCKKRLQDIWEVKKNTIRNAGVTQGRAFYYLKSLILSVDNFTNISNEKKNCFVDNKNSKNATDFRQFWYKRYIGTDGLKVKIFDGTAEVEDAGRFRVVPTTHMGSIYEAIQIGKLKLIFD